MSAPFRLDPFLLTPDLPVDTGSADLDLDQEWIGVSDADSPSPIAQLRPPRDISMKAITPMPTQPEPTTKMSQTMPLSAEAKPSYQSHFDFTVSVRGKPTELPVMSFLRASYPHMPLAQIDSLFGFVERCTLYGGRFFRAPQLTDSDVQVMYENDIGVRLPLTNHTVDEHEYASYAWMFDKYHLPGNAVIVTNDKLARWIRRDFPDFRIEASVIKEIDSHEKIDRAMELYDTIVLPMRINLDEAFLVAIGEKSRITLFANAGCALTCPSKICYPSVSKANKTANGAQLLCSAPLKARDTKGMIDFDLDQLGALGFSRFKMLRERTGVGTGY